jgi:hypothetical protein
MTDRPSTIARAPTASPPPRVPTTGESPRSARGSPQTRKTHPLLSAFPLAVMTLATFLVLFTLMMARLKAGADPALRAGTGSSLAVSSLGAGTVTTRTSGGGASASLTTPAVASEESSGTAAGIVTRASGAPGAREAGDE